MGRPRHTKKPVEDAIQEAEKQGWHCKYPSGHWGRLFCPFFCKCQIGVNGTPKNADVHAKQIKAAIKRCPKETE